MYTQGSIIYYHRMFFYMHMLGVLKTFSTLFHSILGSVVLILKVDNRSIEELKSLPKITRTERSPALCNSGLQHLPTTKEGFVSALVVMSPGDVWNCRITVLYT